MGYQIFTGHRLESLVDAHLDRFESPLLGPRPTVVLQSQSLAQWLKLHLARKRGGYATGDFVFQDEALRRLLQTRSSAPVLFLDDLKFALYHHLARVLGTDPVYAPLTAAGPPDPARLFELADHIAGVFHNYAMNSQLWPRALSDGVLPPVGADAASFAWQSRLWRDLLGDRGTLAGVLMDTLTRSPPPPEPAKPVLLLVGSAFLSRRAAAFLRSWADAGLIDVAHLLLLPAPPQALALDRRPWTSWGMFGRAFLRNFPVPAPAEAPLEGGSALQDLQALLTGAARKPVPDASLQVASAPHPLRELEALRDRLLTALAEDPSLEVNQIAVLAPDINVYAPFLDAVFTSDDPGRNLRFHVIDLDLGRENAWFRALDSLLSLISGKVDRPTLFGLLETPAFAEAWNLEPEDLELWLDYTEAVSAWREDGAAQSWSGSWDRLFSAWFGAPEARGIDVSGSAFRSLGRFHALLEDLRARSRETRRGRTFVDWVRFLEQLMTSFLSPGEGTGAALAGRLRTLVAAGGLSEELPWAGFRAFVQDQIAHFPGRRGQLLTEGVHCSSLRPLRAIPFRVIAVLGLDEGKFPGQTPSPSFDLRRHETGQDEVSSAALDRYTFWETVMAASSVLYLSYQGRSAVDGTPRPPSPVLADLLDLLEESGAPWPVKSISVKDFSYTEPGVTWSPRTLRRALAADAAAPPPPEPAPPVEDVFAEVRTGDVVLAFTAPTRFHLQKVRQVVLRDEDRRGVEDEEPWSLTFLDRQAWLQEGLRRRLNGDHAWDADGFLDTLAATGRVREGVFAERDRRELDAQARRVEAWAQELTAQGWRPGPASGRRFWAGRPWAPEPGERLSRGGEVLVPRLLYSESVPVRTKWDAAVRLLLEPAPAVLATLTPRGEARELSWTLDGARTAELTARAESYWREAAARPLAFYPDFIDAVAGRRGKFDEPWERSVEEAWRTVKNAHGVQSLNNLTNCPYAQLAFPDPAWPSLTAELRLWWDDLFVPLLGAWS